MDNKQNIQRHIDRRLSALNASAARRARIKAAVEEERQGNNIMRHKKTTALMVAAVCALMLASLAIAEGLNLFHLFGKEDARYEQVAEQAALATALPQPINDRQLGQVNALIDSAYWDGLTLNVAFKIEQGMRYEAYTPDEETLKKMAPADPMPVAIDESAPGVDVLTAYNNALAAGTPFGYRLYSVSASDHTVTDDGIDIPPYASSSRYTKDGAYYELREFETPLPAALSGRETLNLAIKLYRNESIFYFDGQQAYALYHTGEAGHLTAGIPLTPNAVVSLEGQGRIGGVPCKAAARVSKTAATLTVSADAPFAAFLQAPPEGTDPFDTWTEVVLTDEKGRVYRPQSGFDTENGTEGAVALLGTGELPETLKLYLYTTWESADTPNYANMDSITLSVQK